VLSCVVCSLSLSLLFRSLSFLTSLVISSRFSIYVSLSSSRFSLYRPLSLISHHPLLSFPISYLSLHSILYVYYYLPSLFSCRRKMWNRKNNTPLVGWSMLKEDGYDPECEHPHCPSICWYNTASFAMVSRGPDMTSLLLIRMSYLSYTLLCTYNSSGMHETSLDTSIR
jgi:hypothetical protein